MRFGLKSLFVLTAIVAVLAAGASAAGWPGFCLSMLFLSFVVGIAAGRTRHSFLWATAWVLFALFTVALLVPSVRHSPPGGYSRRDACLNQLKQLGLAIFAYERVHGTFPPACTLDKSGKPLTSWRTLMLPYLEENDLFAKYSAGEPWDSPNNKPLAQRPLNIFQCPSDFGVAFTNSTDTSYVAIIGPGTAWLPGRGIKWSEIKDNPADTILLVEIKKSGIPWAEPRNLDLTNLPPGITPQNLLQSLANHNGVFNALFADGHVESIPITIPWSDFMALLTIAGGETVDRNKW